MNIKKTSNLLLNFAIKRLAEMFGIATFVMGTLLCLALISYSPDDPNFIFPKNTKIQNLLGFKGSFTSDLFFQSVGLVAYLVPLHLPYLSLDQNLMDYLLVQYLNRPPYLSLNLK